MNNEQRLPNIQQIQENEYNEKNRQQNQLFMRDDITQLFDNMTVTANFNLKKYNKKKQFIDQRKSNDITNNLNPSQLEKVKRKMTTQPNQSYQSTQLHFNQTMQIQQFSVSNDKKSTVFNTTNLNKLMKKNQTKTFYGGSIIKNPDLNKTSTNISSGEKSNKKNDNIVVRKKIMSLSLNKPQINRTYTQPNESQSMNKAHAISMIKSPFKPVISQVPLVKPANKYVLLQKKHNKGRLQFKEMQNWLNNIIQQYCYSQQFDRSLSFPALKKYYIDQNSLLSSGVSHSDVCRLYNSLFVYSIGFNNFIQQITQGNKQITKNIWRVFSLLLEYCAKGNYQTLVGEMERDKIRKLEELKQEIQKRQILIERNQQINQDKNGFIFRELKRLKDQNLNLTNQREILMEDFQQADQAFNQEVGLRLKFQNTINQVYGVYKELSNKHGRLFHDFQQKIQELKKYSLKYFYQTKVTQNLKQDYIQLKQKHNQLCKVNNHDKQHIDVLLIQLAKNKQTYSNTYRELQTTKCINLQRNRKVQQMYSQIQNMKIILQMREKSSKQTHQQYQLTLQQNNKLFSAISQQRTQMQVLIKQKKQFNQNVLKILADSSYYKKKVALLEKQLKEVTDKKLQLEQDLNNFSIQNDISTKEFQYLKADLQANYLNIKQMHAKNFQLEEELHFLRRYEDNVDHIIEEKNKTIQQMKQKVQKLEQNKAQIQKDFSFIDSKYKILQIQFKAEQSSSIKKFQQFKRQQQKLSINESSLSKILKASQAQLQSYKVLFNNTLMDFKNQKFQRGNLIQTYDQILKVLQKKNQQQKQAAIRINQLSQQLNQYKVKYKSTYLNLINTTEQFIAKVNLLTNKINYQQRKIQYKAQHVHRMVYQDIIERFNNLSQNKDHLQQEYQQYQQQRKNERISLEKLIKNLKIHHQNEKEKIQQDFYKKQDKLNQQLDYLKQINDKISKKLIPLQQLQASYKQKVKQFKQKEEKNRSEAELMEQIRQKSVKIDLLYKQIQKIHDSKAEQMKILQQKIKQSQNEKMNFIYEFKTKKQREIKESLQTIYISQLQTLRHKINEQNKKINMLRPKSTVNSSEVDPLVLQNQNIYADDILREAIQSKSLEEILSLKMKQIQSSQTSNAFLDQIQEFFRKSTQAQAIQILARTTQFSSLKKNNQNEDKSIYSKPKNEKVPSYLQKIQNNNNDIRKRSEVSRKLKMTYDYYGKINK